MKYLRIVISVLLVAVTSTSPVFAKPDEATMDFFADNDIRFYDPSGMERPCNEATPTSTGGTVNTDYAGNNILNDAQLEKIQEYKPIYERVAAEVDIPWQAIAVLHLREHSLSIYNPKNGQGIYQLYSLYQSGTTFPYGDGKDVSLEEFERQTKLAAEFFKNKNKNMTASGSPEEVKKAFYYYNGTAGVYVKQGIALGFSEIESNMGDGSPYVMNRADIKRDPTVEPTKSNNTWGQIKEDGGSISYPANNDHGAFVIFSALSGIGSQCTGGGLVSGGMTLEQAKEFIKDYSEGFIFQYYEGKGGSGRGDATHYGLNLTNCVGGSSRNCVAFSEYFINRYTTNPTSGMPGGKYGLPSGGSVVERLVSYGFQDGGTTPRAYAVFSIKSGTMLCGGVPCGHTGVVLGIDEARGKIIIGEAGCSSSKPGNPGSATEQDLSIYTSGKYTYAYTDNFLKGFGL